MTQVEVDRLRQRVVGRAPLGEVLRDQAAGGGLPHAVLAQQREERRIGRVRGPVEDVVDRGDAGVAGSGRGGRARVVVVRARAALLDARRHAQALDQALGIELASEAGAPVAFEAVRGGLGLGAREVERRGRAEVATHALFDRAEEALHERVPQVVLRECGEGAPAFGVDAQIRQRPEVVVLGVDRPQQRGHDDAARRARGLKADARGLADQQARADCDDEQVGLALARGAHVGRSFTGQHVRRRPAGILVRQRRSEVRLQARMQVVRKVRVSLGVQEDVAHAAALRQAALHDAACRVGDRDLGRREPLGQLRGRVRAFEPAPALGGRRALVRVGHEAQYQPGPGAGAVDGHAQVGEELHLRLRVRPGEQRVEHAAE